MADLNPKQHAAVHYIDSPLLVLAGAGSGKTRVITTKIAHLIQQCGYAPHSVAAVTFTNKAAREMKQRVGKLLRGKEVRGLRVSTFHTLGLDIIRRELQHVGLSAGFSIFDTSDSQTVIKELLKRDNGDQEMVQQLQQQISAWKGLALTPEQLEQDSSQHAHADVIRLYASYNRHLLAYNAVDFDDLIRLPLQLFQHNEEALQRWQNRIRYLLVDEYQDTNTTQYQLVRLLVGVRQALTVVGDDDQSIYAWRGAQPENLSLLQQDFPRLKVIKLEQNYRSMGRILRVANHLISHNPHLFDKKLWSDKGIGEPIRLVGASDEESEAIKVVTHLLHHKVTQGGSYSDYAILYRSNHQSRPLEKALREHRIAYHVSGGTAFFSHTEVKDIMAYMRLLSNQDDDAAFLRVVNTPRREIGAATLEKLGRHAQNRGCSLFGASFEFGLQQQLSERSAAKLQHFCDWIVYMADRAKRDHPVEVAKALINEINYEEWLNDSGSSPKQAERKMANVNELVEWLQKLHDEAESDNVTLGDLVARLSLYDILERQSEQDMSEVVRLMTLHSAKGLEFPNVYLVGMEEGMLPHQNSIDSDTIEEERRLAYVGITRAQKNLSISFAARRKKGGEMVACDPSRFIKELPQDDLQREGIGAAQKSPEEQQKHGKQQLAGLKAMLQ